MTLKNLTPLNGFDKTNLQNAKQNNYAWSICELDDYVYVGTCKNMGLTLINALTSGVCSFNMPLSLSVNELDTRGEIWRYRKDGTREWERVYKLREQSNNGFRYMINFTPYSARTALFASSASLDNKVPIKILMTYDGIVWKEVQRNVKGTSSRTMEVHNGKLYVATTGKMGQYYLYSNDNPEMNNWDTIIDSDTQKYDPSKNPTGSIFNIKSFNNHLYVGISTENGAEVWKSKDCEPKVNEWIKIGESGYGNPKNTMIISMNVYRDHLYFSTIGQIPNIFLIPRGADLIRVDKDDKYEVIVGKNSESGYMSGFNNPLNLYLWQICEYRGDLYVSTFDHGTNIQTILEIILLNEKTINRYLMQQGYKNVTADMIEIVLKAILKILKKINYKYGFNLFVSHDGVKFEPVILDGIGNAENYGGRMLYVDSLDSFYIGTANPYEGCEVWKTDSSLINNCVRGGIGYPDIDMNELESKIKEMTELFLNK